MTKEYFLLDCNIEFICLDCNKDFLSDGHIIVCPNCGQDDPEIVFELGDE